MGGGASSKKNKCGNKSAHNLSGHKDSSDMSFFRKQSDSARQSYQDKLYIATESPDPTVDISHCEINVLPEEITTLCRTQKKEALLLHSNWLSSISTEGMVRDLMSIRVLDVHNNELTSLPDELCDLPVLQVLDASGNRLKSLPHNIGQLETLQTLNVKDNKITHLPSSICRLKSLRTLDLSHNRITHLPKELCHIRTLVSLVVDSDIQYPDPEICCNGTESIMRFLCTECGVEYEAPSNFLLDVLDPPKSPTHQSVSSAAMIIQEQDRTMQQSLAQYTAHQNHKRAENLALEKEMADQQQHEAKISALSAEYNQHLMFTIAQKDAQLQSDLEELTRRKELERRSVVQTMQDAEQSASELLRRLLEMNENARKTEEIMEAMEVERIDQEKWFIVRQEEFESLRKQDVLAAMEDVLKDTADFDDLFKIHQSNQEKSTRQARQRELDEGKEMKDALDIKQISHDALLSKIIKQEQLQKEAFEALQLQKDSRHNRLTSEIVLIEEELAGISQLERDRQQEKQLFVKEMLVEKRKLLAELLIQLMTERDKRQQELKKRLLEMEHHRLEGQMDYWLIQYQRLMERKPEVLVDQESQLEILVLKILEQAGAAAYLSLFARHRITMDILNNMTDADLKSLGVYEMGVRRSILERVEHCRNMETTLPSAPATVKIMDDQPSAPLPPSAPPGEDTPHPPTTPPRQLVARGVNSECAICLDNQSNVIFLMCGHVCCCEGCCSKVDQCPLCRAPIEQIIKLAVT